MTFWFIIVVLAALVALSLLWALLRRTGTAARKDVNIAVYRDQLAEVDRDLSRGVIAQEAAERTRTEIARRILDADKARDGTRPDTAPQSASALVGVATALVVIGGALGLYQWLGAPGYGDLPLTARIEAAEEMRQTRPDQSTAERQAAAVMPPFPEADAEHQALVDRLRGVVAERPEDERGLRLLARNEAALGNFNAAHAAQARLVDVLGDRATSGDYAELADLLVIAAGGYVSPEAEDALKSALAREDANGTALYYTGLMYLQTGRPDLAYQIWQDLVQRSPPDAPWVQPIRAQLPEVAARAGIRTRPAIADMPGPSTEDMEAAAQLSPEDRMEMIRGMVDGLASRLANEGGPPEEWARLISALGVLGETGSAAEIFSEAQQVFTGDTAALAVIHSAAQSAGLIQ